MGDSPGVCDVPARSSWIAGAENSRLKPFFFFEQIFAPSHLTRASRVDQMRIDH